MPTQQLRNAFRTRGTSETRQPIEHREVGFTGAVLLETLPPRRPDAPRGGFVPDSADQRGLADAGLASDEHKLTFSLKRALEPAVHSGQLCFTSQHGSHARHGAIACCTSRLCWRLNNLSPWGGNLTHEAIGWPARGLERSRR